MAPKKLAVSPVKLKESPTPKENSPLATPPVEPHIDGHYELNPLMSRMLAHELQQIMIQVWQELPDDPATEGDKLVAEKFRNEAGDELSNVLGLNVTKRLLNIYNPLNLKVHFSTKPDMKCLKEFLKKYKFVAFKRIARMVNTFAAQLKNIADFDELCSLKKISCGAARITVTPCYRFTQCPQSLKTIYYSTDGDKPPENVNMDTELNVTNDDASKEVTNEDNNITKGAVTNISSKEIKTIEKKPEENKSVTPSKTTGSNVKNEKKTVATINTQASKENASIAPKPTNPKTMVTNANTIANNAITAQPVKTDGANKIKATPVTVEKTEANVSNTKITEPIKSQPKTVTPTNNVTKNLGTIQKAADPAKTVEASKPKTTPVKVVKTDANVSNTKITEPTKSQPKTVTPTNNATKNIGTIAKAAEPAKTEKANKPKTTPVKVAAANVTNTKVTEAVKTQANNPNSKPAAVVNSKNPVSTKSVDEITKNTNPKVTKTEAKPKAEPIKSVKNPLEGKDDYEELDDQDILALISGGIVLDECSGSDDEE